MSTYLIDSPFGNDSSVVPYGLSGLLPDCRCGLPCLRPRLSQASLGTPAVSLRKFFSSITLGGVVVTRRTDRNEPRPETANMADDNKLGSRSMVKDKLGIG